MTEPATMGRRQRKKAATRKLISDIATRLFLERGFDNVSIREIADAADVSPTTVFAHFPQKEALVFDEEDDQRERLVRAIRTRPGGTTIAQALHDYLRADYDEAVQHAGENASQVMRIFMDLVHQTPALSDYEARMWVRHEGTLAATIADEFGLAEPDDEIRVYARFVLQIWQLMHQSPDPGAMLEAAFALLDRGWAVTEARHADARNL